MHAIAPCVCLCVYKCACMCVYTYVCVCVYVCAVHEWHVCKNTNHAALPKCLLKHASIIWPSGTSAQHAESKNYTQETDAVTCFV